MSRNKTVLIVILVIVSVVILAVAVLILRETKPAKAAEVFEPSVESMDDITIPVWGVIIPTPEYIRATSVVAVSDGGSLFAGYCYHDENTDYCLTRMDAAGSILWQRAYGAARTENMNGNVAETLDGGFIFSGWTNTFAEGINGDSWIMKVDGEGAVQWSKVIGHPKSSENAQAVKVLPDGGYILAAQTNAVSSWGRENWWIIKLDPDGDILWQKTYGGSTGRENPADIILTSDGGFICVGTTATFGEGSNDAWVIKLGNSGLVEWQETFGGPEADWAESVVEVAGKGYAIAGATRSAGSGENDGWIIFLRLDGTVLWQRLYGNSGSDWLNRIVLTDDGTFLVAGSCTPEGADTADGLLMRLDEEGNPLWQRSYGGPAIEFIPDVAETADGGLITLGRSSPASAEDEEAEYLTFILKLTADGRPLYRRTALFTFGEPVTLRVLTHEFPAVQTEVYPWDTEAKAVTPKELKTTDMDFPAERLFSSDAGFSAE